MAILPSESARPEVITQVVVIGAGACGLTAALAARERGAEVLAATMLATMIAARPRADISAG